MWDTPGVGRPELHWRIVRVVTLAFTIGMLAVLVGFGLLVVAVVVALASGAGVVGGNK